MRSIGDNSTRAHIFLSKENYQTLDKELKSNFATSVSELSATDQKSVEHTLKIEKKKTVTVKKILKEIVAVKDTRPSRLKIDFSKFKATEYQQYISEGGIYVDQTGKAGFKEARATKKIKDEEDFTFYEIVERINRHTHLSCADVDEILQKSGKDRVTFTKEVNKTPALMAFVIQQILNQVYQYEEKTEEVEETLELTKLYPFKISVKRGQNGLVVYREDEEADGSVSRIGFHINPYNFDSGEEKDLFRYLRDYLDDKEGIADVYFTGGVTDATHNDFYFEYWSPEKQRIARYFPDLLVETTKGRYLVIEVKGNDKKVEYEASKKRKHKDVREIVNEVHAKEVGFDDFQKVNKNFEYRIVFNASLKAEQVRILEDIKKL